MLREAGGLKSFESLEIQKYVEMLLLGKYSSKNLY